eukprot:TRINITY_DN26876_c0_g1_i1.p1 TRINITY_DN26876_c0_g1~~TRINITY_DN26876_c0_g1_i1.p1  ORF type:complete len:106 (+),score=15.70 TRINITY_DN26876_c0_g1_i1:154-471(+)
MSRDQQKGQQCPNRNHLENSPVRYDGASPENGPKYLTLSGPYHGLPDEAAGFFPVFLMEILPLPKSSDEDGATFTAIPANDGEERAIVEAAILLRRKKRQLWLCL